MEKQLSNDHYLALKEAVYPMRFPKNAQGIKKMNLVRKALDYVKNSCAKSDIEIAMDEQNIFETKIPNVFFQPTSFLLMTWTDKGFKSIGNADHNTVPDILHAVAYCVCAYPDKEGMCCKKCKKLML